MSLQRPIPCANSTMRQHTTVFLLDIGSFPGAGHFHALSYSWDGIAWNYVLEANPPGREGGILAPDTTGNLILFGGNNGTTLLSDTWSFNGSLWSQLSPATSPAA